MQVLWKATTAKGNPGYEERKAQATFGLLVMKEYIWWQRQNKRPITKTQYIRNLRDAQKLNASYKRLVTDYPKTRYAVRAKAATNRLEKPIANMVETVKRLKSAPTAPRSGGARLGTGRELPKHR